MVSKMSKGEEGSQPLADSDCKDRGKHKSEKKKHD